MCVSALVLHHAVQHLGSPQAFWALWYLTFSIPCSYRLGNLRRSIRNISDLKYFCNSAREMDLLLEYSITVSLSESMSFEVKSPWNYSFYLSTIASQNRISIAGQWLQCNTVHLHISDFTEWSGQHMQYIVLYYSNKLLRGYVILMALLW